MGTNDSRAAGAFKLLCALGLALLVAACASSDSDGPTGQGGTYKVGKPYQVGDNWYYPKEDPLYDETGLASWYGREFAGRRTANGEIFNPRQVTGAHKTLPMPSNVRVTNIENGKSLVVRVNDRGPFKPSRIIDLSEEAATLLGFKSQGIARVRVQFLEVAELPKGKPGKRVAGKGEHADLGAPPSRAKAAPSTKVSGGALPPPPGTVAAPAVTPEPLPGDVPVPVTSPLDEPTGSVTTVPVANRGRLYVQAGAFLDIDNANRLLRRLKAIADFKISSKTQDGKRYHRVRAGPIATVDEADAILDRVLDDGQKGAEIVVE